MKTSFLTFVLLAIVYSVYVKAVPPSPYAVTVSQESLNQQTVERYRYRVDPEAVIVGSSLSARFAEAVSSGCFYDLSIAGGSALTGLDIVQQKARKPDSVFIEINLLERSVDQRFVDAPLPFRRYLPITWVENSPINRMLSFIADQRRGAEPPPPVAVLKAPLHLQQQDYDRPLTPGQINRIVGQMRPRLAAIRAQGMRPIFFEMPVHPSLMNRIRAQQMRQLVRQAFPDIALVPGRRLAAPDAIRTTDGVHLQEFEARRVFQRLVAISGVRCVEPGAGR